MVTVMNVATGTLVREIDVSPNAPTASPIVVDGRIVVAGNYLEAYGL